MLSAVSTSHSDCASELATSDGVGSKSSGSDRSKLTIDVDTVPPGLGGRHGIVLGMPRYTFGWVGGGEGAGFRSGGRGGKVGSDTRVELSETDMDKDIDTEAE